MLIFIGLQSAFSSLIIQWGRWTGTATKTITLLISFSNTTYTGLLSMWNTSNGTAGNPYFIPKTTSTADLNTCDKGGKGQWLAIGY